MRQRIAPFALLAALCLISVATADDHGQQVLAKFKQHVQKLDQLEAKQRNRVADILQQSADDPQYAITEALVLMHQGYGKAIESADTDDAEAAVKALRPLLDSKDRFLAADASFYLARTLMNTERFEEAMPLLKQLTGELGPFTAHQGAAQYFTGVAQAGLLENKAAIESLMQFLQFNPDAPERLRVSAWRQIQQLQSIKNGKLNDVYQRMDFSRRRLELIETGEITQEEQDKIVKMLTKLIKEEEKKECANCKGGKSDKPGQKQSQQQAQSKPSQSKSQKGGSSSNPNGKAIVKNYNDDPASPWSRLRDRSRDPANNAVKDKLPARYRAIVEKYIENANGGK